MSLKRTSSKRAGRPARERAKRQQDARLVATQVTADAPGVKRGDWIVSVAAVDMDDGRRLMWHPPQPVAFTLLEAKRYRELAAPFAPASRDAPAANRGTVRRISALGLLLDP